MASFTSIGIGIGFLVAATSAGEPITCAVISVATGEDRQLELITLLEHRLAQDSEIALVEWGAFNAILREQQLQLALAATGAEVRQRLGQILRAELLLLVERIETKAHPAVRLVVAETKLGLRLAVEIYPWEDTAVETLAGDMAAALSRARLLSTGSVPTIVAVPPFECQDFTFEHNHLTYAYAALAQRSLLSVPGVVVVELEEARAIAEEFHRSPGGKTVSRPLPLYVIGKYRTRSCDDTFRVSYELEIRQGSAVLETISTVDLPATAMAAHLDAQVRGMIEERAEPVPKRIVSAQQGIQILNERAARFRRLGDWAEAMALIEASLLLDAGQTELHFEAVRGYGKLTNVSYDPYGGVDNFSCRAAQGLGYHRAGLVHLETIYRSDDCKWRTMMNDVSEYWGSARSIEQYSQIPEETRRLCRDWALEKREMLLAVLEDRARDGTLTDDMVALLHHYIFNGYTDLEESLEENYAIRLRAIRTVLPLRQAERWIGRLAKWGSSWSARIDPAYDTFLDQLEALPGNAVRIAVGKLRQDLQETKDRELNRTYRAKAITPTIAPKSEGPAEVAFSKIKPCLVENDGNCAALHKRIHGWLRCGEGTDVIHTHKSLFVMKEKGKLNRVFESADQFFNFHSVCFDGRYVWAPVIRKTEPLVVLLDPQTEQTWRFTKEDGLPPTSGYVTAAPVAAGLAVVSGEFASQGAGRSWVAILKFGVEEGKSVDVIHRAKYQPDQRPGPYRPAKSVDDVFTPRFIVPLHEPNAPDRRRFLIYINNEVGLLVDAMKRSVELAPNAFTHQLENSVTCRGGFGYWVWRGTARGQRRASTLWRVGFPDFQKASVQTGFANEIGANVLFANGQVHAVGKSWWTADNVNGEFREVAAEIPGRMVYRRFCKSNHYGDVLLASGSGVYKVLLGPSMGRGRLPPDGN